MHDTIRLRPARLDDLPALLEFEQHIVAAERPYAPHLKPGKIHYYDIAAFIASDDAHVVVATVEDKPVASGYARIEKSKNYYQHDRHSYLGFMYVTPEHRGKGINRLILDALLSWSREKGINAVYLDVYADNEQALRAYQKAGFASNLIEMRLDLDTGR